VLAFTTSELNYAAGLPVTEFMALLHQGCSRICVCLNEVADHMRCYMCMLAAGIMLSPGVVEGTA
jgi:hypothetical protein